MAVKTEAPAILGASVTGHGHERSGLPCQDAFQALVSEGALVIVVSDGLGSAPRSDIGAMTASRVAAERAMEVACADPVRAAVEGVIAGREALEQLAVDEACSLSDLACTLIVAVVTDRIGIAHVGDGAAVGMCSDESYVLSPPAPSEYVNEVDSLASDEWIDHIRVVGCLDGIEAIGVLTDGCQHAAVRRNNAQLLAHTGFFRPLFDFVRSGVGAEEGNAELAKLLGGRKIGEHSDDDKTLVLAVLR